MTSGSVPGTQGSHKGLLSSRKHSREMPAPLDSAARPMVTGAPVVTDEAVAKADPSLDLGFLICKVVNSPCLPGLVGGRTGHTDDPWLWEGPAGRRTTPWRLGRSLPDLGLIINV